MTKPHTFAFLIREPAEVYHAKARENLSSHALADFRRCPLLYRRKQLGLIPDTDRPAYQIGRAAHTLILEGRPRFDAEYAIGGPINEKTGKSYGPATKAFAEWAEQQGKPVITEEQAVLIEQMAAAVRAHDGATRLLAEGIAEGVVRTRHLDLACQGRFDWLFTGDSPALVDLKTCDSLDWFEGESRVFGYIHQLAFYRSLLWQQTGALLPVHLIAVEKKEPFRCGVWMVGADVLAIAQQENEAAMKRLRQFQQTDHWPTGYEEPRVLDHL